MINIDIKDIEKAPSDWSDIFDYKENIPDLLAKIEKIDKGWKNIIVVGNGGSITSYDAYRKALPSARNSATVWTMDPFALREVKKKFNKSDTVVIAVSKSGNTLGQIESLLYFNDYDIVVVTDPGSGALSEIAKKMNWDIIEHPPVGGRFSGGTSSAFVPSLLAGIDIESIQSGIIGGYEKFKDQAYTLSKYYFDMEKRGYGEVYISIYSVALEGFQNLIIQLMHESVCKDGKGQTFYISMAPESQHHTNQRFLGGKRNVIGTFICSTDTPEDEKIMIPDKISSIGYKGEKLGFINGLNYQEALRAEYQGTKQDADRLEIPNVTIELGKINEETVGELVSFWHMVAFYSSILRKVDPFDQPAVETSKNITLDIIKENF